MAYLYSHHLDGHNIKLLLAKLERSGHFACEQISTKRLMSGTNAIGQLWERLLQFLQEISIAWCSGAKIHHITCICFVRKQFSHCQNPLLLEGQEPFLADSGPT